MAKKPKFCINDNRDVLVEILKRLDDRSLAVSACVCRLWCSITRQDSFWENLCFRHVSPAPPSHFRPVVVALGGYRRLYMVCVRPVLARLSRPGSGRADSVRIARVPTRDEVQQLQLSLSLFSVYYYDGAASLLFLRKPKSLPTLNEGVV